MLAAPCVSVIVPVYNKRAYVDAAIKSVLEQEFSDCEIIVVDDGSTDGSCDALVTFGDQIRLYRQEHSGPSRARNFGIDKARGRYIAFLDADDEWFPTKLSVQIEFLESNPDFYWVSANSIVEMPDGRSHYRNQVLDNLENGTWYRPSDWFAEVRRVFPIGTSGLVFRREALDEIGLFDEDLSAGQDYDLCFRSAIRYPRIASALVPLYRYREDVPGAVSQKTRHRFNSLLVVLRKHLDRERGRNVVDTRALRVVADFDRYIRRAIYHGFSDLAREALSLAPAAFPRSRKAVLFLLSLTPGPLIRTAVKLRRQLRQHYRPLSWEQMTEPR